MFLFEKLQTKDLVAIKKSLRVLIRCSECFNKTFLQSFSMKVKDVIFKLYSEIDEETIKVESKSNLIEPLNYLNVLLYKSFNLMKSSEISDPFLLKFCLKIFNTECDIEKRLGSLAEIKVLLREASEEDIIRKKGQPKRWITVKYMNQWILDNSLFSNFFSRDLHAELLRYVRPFILFIANTRGLDNKELDIIWNSWIGKHEATQRTVHELILKILPSLNQTCVDYFYDKVESLTFQDLNKQILAFIKEFTEAAVIVHQPKAKKKKWYGIDLFWYLLQDYHKSKEFEELAYDHLRSLLILEDFEIQRKRIMKACMDNIKDHFSVNQSMALLTSLIYASPNYKKKKTAIWTLLDSLNEKFKLIDIIFMDLSYLKNNAPQEKSFEQKNLKLSELILDESNKLNSKYSLGEQIQARLSFLALILHNYSLNYQNVVTIINLFPNDSNEYEYCIQFLETISKMDDVFEPGVLEKVFEEIIQKWDIEKMTDKEFKLFITLFININLKNNLMTIIQEESNALDAPKPLKYIVGEKDLIGIQHLWKIIKNSNQNVAENAIKYMNDFKLNFQNKEKIKELRENHIKSCMKEIQDLYEESQKGKEKLESKIERCLMTLYEYLIFFKKDLRGHGTSSGLPLNVRVINANGKNFKLTLQSIDPVSRLVNRISQELDTPSNLLTILIDDKELVEEKKTLVELQFKPDQLIYVKRLDMNDLANRLFNLNLKKMGFDPFAKLLQKRMIENIKKLNTSDTFQSLQINDSTTPVDILQKDEYFTILFSLLDMGDNVAKKVWSILFYLPTNEKISQSLKDISQDVKWENILSHSSHKLLYQLQILNNLSQHNTLDTTFDLEKWIKNFNDFGGVHILIKTLLDHENLSQESSSLLIKVINTFLKNNMKLEKELLDKIVEKILKIGCEYKGLQENDLQIIQNVMLLLSTCLKNKAKIDYKENTKFTEWMIHCLLESKFIEIRKTVSSSLQEIISVEEDSRQFFAHFLYKYIQNIADYEETCDYYFSLLETVLSSPIEGFNEKEVLLKIVNRIKNRPIKERIDQPDQLLIGYLKISKSIFMWNDDLRNSIGKTQGFVKYIFNTCLFETPKGSGRIEIQPPKCKSQKSREEAYCLLIELAKTKDNYIEIIQNILPLLKNIERVSWGFSPDGTGKTCGYVGLRNPSSVCYMNSLLQQFYMIPKFRNSLFKVKIPSVEDMKKDDNINLLYQLQLMFGYLHESNKKYYDAKTFLAAYKDFTGEPINISIQQDTYEFFLLFIDKIEAALKALNEENIYNLLKGRFLTQIIAEGHISETIEPFLVISVEVKAKKDIQESLDLYIQGEKLEGENKYYSEFLQKRVDALKRSCVKELPEILILHLKRFEFDFEKRKNVKINDRLEFFNELDMFPYTVEGITHKEGKDLEDYPIKDKEYYQYELVGILVHQGSAEIGHYSSYIMDRETKKWYEFNDQNISPFNTNDIPKECFGDDEELKEVGKTLVKTKIPRTKNAYMLFYQRKSGINNIKEEKIEKVLEKNQTIESQDENKEIKLKEQTIESQDENKENSNLENSEVIKTPEKMNPVIETNTPQDSLLTPLIINDQDLFSEDEVPPPIKEIVWKENSSFFLNNYVFNSDFSNFIWRLTFNSKLDDTVSIELVSKFIIEVLSHSKDVENQIDIWTSLIYQIFQSNEATCKWFLEHITKEPNWKNDIFLHCPISSIRSSFVKLSMFCIKKIAPNEEYVSTESLISKEKDQSVVANFISSIIGLFTEGRFHYKQIGEMIQLLYEFSEIGVKEKKFLISKDVLSDLVNCLQGSPEKYSSKQIYYGFPLPFTKHTLHYSLQLASSIILSCETSSSIAHPPPTLKRIEGHTLNISQKDAQKFFSKIFFGCLVQENVNMNALNDILLHWCWENRETSQKFSAVLIDHLTDSNNLINSLASGASIVSSQKPYTEILDFIIEIDDSIKKERIVDIMDEILKGMKEHMKCVPSTYTSLSFVLSQYKKNKIVQEWYHSPVVSDDFKMITSYHKWNVNFNAK